MKKLLMSRRTQASNSPFLLKSEINVDMVDLN